MLKQISVALGPPGPDPVSIFFSEVKSQVLTACYSLYPTNVDIPSKVDSLFLALAAQVELEQKSAELIHPMSDLTSECLLINRQHLLKTCVLDRIAEWVSQEENAALNHEFQKSMTYVTLYFNQNRHRLNPEQHALVRACIRDLQSMTIPPNTPPNIRAEDFKQYIIKQIEERLGQVADPSGQQAHRVFLFEQQVSDALTHSALPDVTIDEALRVSQINEAIASVTQSVKNANEKLDNRKDDLGVKQKKNDSLAGQLNEINTINQRILDQIEAKERALDGLNATLEQKMRVYTALSAYKPGADSLGIKGLSNALDDDVFHQFDEKAAPIDGFIEDYRRAIGDL